MKLRRFLSLLLVAALFVGLSSCSKDDDKDEVPSSVIGTWKYVKTELDFKISNNEIRDAFNQLAKGGDLDEDPHTITLTEDGEYIYKEGNTITDSGDYYYSAGVLELDGDPDIYKVTLSGNTLKISYDALDEMDEMLQDEFGVGASDVGLTKFNFVLVYTKQ